MTDPRSWTLRLPYVKPPLSLNHRVHHMARYRLEQGVVNAVLVMVRAERVPALSRCSVQLHYRPLTAGRRDTDNLVATLKPVADGLVAAGVVVDDTPEFMTRPEPIIHPAVKVSRVEQHRALILWVVVTEGGVSS